MPDSNINPVQIQKFLGGIDYPVDKEALVGHAEQRGADANILDALRNLPREEFNSPNDVSQAVAQMRG